jgi:hypothetical protein
LSLSSINSENSGIEYDQYFENYSEFVRQTNIKYKVLKGLNINLVELFESVPEYSELRHDLQRKGSEEIQTLCLDVENVFLRRIGVEELC